MNRLTIGMVLNAVALGASVILTLLAMSLGNEILIIFSLVTSLILAILLTTWEEKKKVYKKDDYDYDYDEDLMEREHFEKDHLNAGPLEGYEEKPETLGDLPVLKELNKQLKNQK